MKKLCILLLVILLCGCGNNSTLTVNTENFESEVHLSFDGNEYTIQMLFKEEKAEFLTVKPENLKDFTLCFENDSVTAKYKSLTYSPNVDFLPNGSAVKMLYKVLNDAKGKPAKQKNNEYILIGNIENTEYKLCISPSGLPQSCEIGDISATFFATSVIN